MKRSEQAPACQLYVADFLADTAGMTPEQIGAYARALAIAWREGGLPTDPAQIARLLGVTSVGFAKLWPVIGALFERRAEEKSEETKTERYVLPWQERQRTEQAEKRRKRSEAGQLGNEVRWHREIADG